MTDDRAGEYDLRAVRDLLVAAYTAEGLKRLFLYSDRAELRALRTQFAPGAGLSDMVDTAIDYCERHVLLAELLDEVRRDNRQQYDRFASRLTRRVEAGGAGTEREVPALTDFDVLPEPAAVPRGSRLPFLRNVLFTGREAALKAVARGLLGEDAARRGLAAQAIYGMGGVGKTQLAVEFAYRYGQYFHGVHWLNAAQPEQIGAEVAECGTRMGLQPWPEKLPEQVRHTLGAWQAAGPRLVVMDYLEEVQVFGEWWQRLPAPQVRVLITGRHTRWPRYAGLNPVPLDVFARRESRAFLRAYVPPERDGDEALDALAERLGHLPLALDLAGHYLAQQPWLSIAEYLAWLQDVVSHSSMTGWIRQVESATGHRPDVAGTFALSWERVQEEGARRVFLAAAWCAPNQPIPREVLAHAAGLDEQACSEALALLADLGLVQIKAAGPAIHKLVAEYGQAVTRELEGDESTRLAALADALARRATEANETRLPARFVPLRAHVRAVASAAEERRLEDAGRLWNRLGFHLRSVAEFGGARRAYERAIAVDEAAFGPEHPAVAGDIDDLGWALHDLGDLEGARSAFECALRIDEAALGQDHPKVAVHVTNLGLMLKDLGDQAGARDAFERAVAIHTATSGPDHPDVARALDNLGNVLKDLGDLEGARAAIERALEIDRAAAGADDVSVARDLNSLGLVLKDGGDLQGARAAIERALEIYQATWGRDHPDVAAGTRSLGLVLKDQGALPEAREAFERALRIDEAAFSPEHPRVAGDLNNLGLVLKDLGDLEGAQEAIERALEIDRAAFGREHPTVASDAHRLAWVLKDLGDLEGARAAMEQALEIDEAAFGSEHPAVARHLNSLGLVLKDQGDLRGAREAIERALRIDETAWGPDHGRVATDANQLAWVLQDMGDAEGARAAMQRAVAIDEAAFGMEHPKVVPRVSNLGLLLKQQGELEGARAAFERAVAILERTMPANDPNITMVRADLAAVERAMEQGQGGG